MAAILCKGAGTIYDNSVGPSSPKVSCAPSCGATDDLGHTSVTRSGGSYYIGALRHICTSPFGVFVTVAFVSNVPPMLIALSELGHIHSCRASVWLLINFLFCWVHIVASFYVAISTHKHRPSSQGQTRSIYQRAAHLFCYDPAMAVYIVTVCAHVVFSFVPKWLNIDQNNAYKSASGQCTVYIHEKVIATVGFAWAFLVFGLGALALSFWFAHDDAESKRHAYGSKHFRSTTSRALVESGTYTTMEEGRGDLSRHHRDSHGMLDENYVPPMITYHPTTTDLDETEIEGTTVQNDTMTADVGFVTDFETDIETEFGGDKGTSLDTTDRHGKRQRRRSSPELLSSFGGNSTSYCGDGTSYEGETDAGNTTDRNYETIDDEQTDLEAGESEEEDSDVLNDFDVPKDPTVSLSLDPDTTRSAEDTNDENGQRTMSSHEATHDESDDQKAAPVYLNTAHLELHGDDTSSDIEPIISSIGTETTIENAPTRGRDQNRNDEMDIDAFPDPSLTYSTSMGTAMADAEPLSFVDGGTCNNRGVFRKSGR